MAMSEGLPWEQCAPGSLIAFVGADDGIERVALVYLGPEGPDEDRDMSVEVIGGATDEVVSEFWELLDGGSPLKTKPGFCSQGYHSVRWIGQMASHPRRFDELVARMLSASAEKREGVFVHWTDWLDEAQEIAVMAGRGDLTPDNEGDDDDDDDE